MAVFGRYGFFQIVVSFFPFSFGGFVQTDEGVDETVGDKMEFFGLQVVLMALSSFPNWKKECPFIR